MMDGSVWLLNQKDEWSEEKKKGSVFGWLAAK